MNSLESPIPRSDVPLRNAGFEAKWTMLLYLISNYFLNIQDI